MKEEMKLEVIEEEEEAAFSPKWLIGSAVMLAVGVVMTLLDAGWTAAFPYILSAALSAWPLFGGAWGEIRRLRLGECTLMLIALAAGFAIGEWSEGAMVALLFAVGEWLEDRAVDRSRDAIRALSDIRPDRAWVERDGERVEVAADAVEVGEVLYVPPFERVPVDGEVIAGVSEINTAALTGESQPFPAEYGTAVLSGSVNGSGELWLRATAPAAASAASRILSLVEDSAARKGRAERFITRFAAVYTPCVTAMAVLVAVVPPLFGGEWLDWIRRALTFLVASCPCALVLSVPLTFYAGIGAASRRGVLVKGGRYLEALSRAKTVYFDKTGTLTDGQLTVTEVTVSADMPRETALSLAAAVEASSAHPLAAALREAAKDLPPVTVTDLRELPARGVTAVWKGHTVLCGGRRLMEEQGVAVGQDAAIFLAVDGRWCASFAAASRIRPSAPTAVSALRSLGVARVVMLTGDTDKAAAEVATATGIASCRAGLLPEDKLAAVESGCADGVTVFVGDGINDAPVLARADVGVAMGMGSAAAIESADVVLVAENLDRLPEAIKLSRRVMRVVRENVGFALAVKAAVLVLAVFGLAPMWLAVFADVGVALLTVANAARLLKIR